jgi:hypothetical protein
MTWQESARRLTRMPFYSALETTKPALSGLSFVNFSLGYQAPT